jgi:hypothetical protein
MQTPEIFLNRAAEMRKYGGIDSGCWKQGYLEANDREVAPVCRNGHDERQLGGGTPQ